ncbi:hypothetical protein HMPREF3037_02759 [Candidatus Stoquefichus sp. KLE1796]|nr:hypothetical protein HMPREF3037_02759 [Candidatus Stoquefichus sp. KLE1796]
MTFLLKVSEIYIDLGTAFGKVVQPRPVQQDNDTPAWCGSAHKNGNS